jgi:GTP cyclohydrolase II
VLKFNHVTTESLLGERAQVEVDRALSEFRSGRPLIISSASDVVTALPVDGMSDRTLAAFRQLSRPVRPFLLVTARRAQAMGVQASGPTGIALPDFCNARDIFSFAAGGRTSFPFKTVPAGAGACAAIELAKQAHRLPALLIGAANSAAVRASEPALLAVSADALGDHRLACGDAVSIAAEVNIPFAGFSARFVVFRDGSGGTPVALVIGSPDPAQPVLVRLHSACLTGDVFGSRRCDCGDQLRLALMQLKEQGSGIVLYLAQEGRGLGLVNKIRTYQLQDGGLDTVDANTVLGFDDDERDYDIAGRMLRSLGCTRVRLMTNNPSKLDGLASAGIDVAGREPLVGPVHPDNQRYLTAKAMRSGHQLDDVLGALADIDTLARDP